jgi:protein subunit release factor A
MLKDRKPPAPIIDDKELLRWTQSAQRNGMDIPGPSIQEIQQGATKFEQKQQAITSVLSAELADMRKEAALAAREQDRNFLESAKNKPERRKNLFRLLGF